MVNGIAGAVLRRYAYGYDKGGNRTSEQTELGVSTATHNDANQLTGVSASAGPVKFAGRLSETGIVYVANSLATMGIQNTSFVAYASLSTGTREVEIKATDYSNQSATNRYQVVITNNGVAKTLSYDINGNLTNVTTATYTNKYEWDGADRLTRVSWRPAGGQWHVTDFTYDGLGRRVKITETTNNIATTNTFVWCGTELCEERNSSGATVNKRFFGQGEQISGTAYFFTGDHLGSIREMSNSGGTIQARYEYDPYGRRTKVSGSGEAAFAFTGHYYHQKSGFYLALYRAYDADTGRWLSRDPIEESGGINLYSYAAADPINGVDPLGLVKWKGVAGATAGAIGNSLGPAGGLALGVATGWSGIGAVAGGVIAVKSGYGLGVNLLNLVDALNDRDGSSKGSLFNDLADLIVPCSKAAQNVAAAVDLVVDLGGAKIAKIAQTLSRADKYGNIILEGGAKLGPVFQGKNAERYIEALGFVQASEALIQSVISIIDSLSPKDTSEL